MTCGACSPVRPRLHPLQWACRINSECVYLHSYTHRCFRSIVRSIFSKRARETTQFGAHNCYIMGPTAFVCCRRTPNERVAALTGPVFTKVRALEDASVRFLTRTHWEPFAAILDVDGIIMISFVRGRSRGTSFRPIISDVGVARGWSVGVEKIVPITAGFPAKIDSVAKGLLVSFGAFKRIVFGALLSSSSWPGVHFNMLNYSVGIPRR